MWILSPTGDLRVCTYCCKVVLSYLQSSNLAADVLADLRALQEELLPPMLSQFSGAGARESALYSSSASNTPLTTPRGAHRRRHSLGFQEERYVARTRYVCTITVMYRHLDRLVGKVKGKTAVVYSWLKEPKVKLVRNKLDSLQLYFFSPPLSITVKSRFVHK